MPPKAAEKATANKGNETKEEQARRRELDAANCNHRCARDLQLYLYTLS